MASDDLTSYSGLFAHFGALDQPCTGLSDAQPSIMSLQNHQPRVGRVVTRHSQQRRAIRFFD